MDDTCLDLSDGGEEEGAMAEREVTAAGDATALGSVSARSGDDNLFASVNQSSPLRHPAQTFDDRMNDFLEERHYGDFPLPQENHEIAGFVLNGEAYSILNEVKQRRPHVFAGLIPQTEWCAVSLLTRFAKFIKFVSQARVKDLNSEKVKDVLTGFEDFERNGIDISWLRGRFEEFQSVDNLKETKKVLEATAAFIAREEEDLELARSLVIKKEQELIALRSNYSKNKEHFDRDMETVNFPLAPEDFILKGIF